MKPVKVTSKGQVTIPVEIRSSLGIDENSYLEVSEVGDEVRMRKLTLSRPLSADDPIWNLIGSGSSGDGHVAENHDRYLADGEFARWRKSS
jgi:transcriptional pleiotropic regulator of transition state genes